MKLAERVFRRKDYYITSPFGYRTDPITGVTTFHYGVDYGTNVQKWAQYALEDGVVTAVGNDSTSGNYIWVRYYRLGYALFHAHLDSVAVSKGQNVNSETILGYTGTTGRSTGIHLHLGLQGIGSSVWENVEKYDYQEEIKPEPSPEPVPTEGINVGDKVTPINPIDTSTSVWRYKDYNGTVVSEWRRKWYRAVEISGDRVVLDAEDSGIIWCAMNINNLKKV